MIYGGNLRQQMAFHQTTEDYFSNLAKEIEKNYNVARLARAKGLDPKPEVEVPLALTMAAKVVKLIATLYPQIDNEDVINRILELEKQYGALDSSVAFKIAEEVAMEKFCKFENQLQAMDAGIRVGFAYITLGVVSSPIEGYTGLKVGKRMDGKNYLKAYFSGPIRSAGTTASCVVLMLIDYIRQIFEYSRYDPTEQEAKRTVTELYDYHERVNNLQYLPTEEEAFFIAKNLPFQVDGDPTEKREVSNFKDLPRIETNFIRGGFCLILGEGLCQKAKKGLRHLKGVQKNGFQIKDWEWLDTYVELHEKRDIGKTDSSPTYIKDLVAGRPVFGYPGKGFRFRYGRSRVAGFSATSVHPCTMGITGDFIATGTQLKIEKPTKGCVVTPCDTIDGPIIKLKNGSVKKPITYEEAKKLYNETSEIIYLGDVLFPLGDVMNRNSVLIKPGYVPEWWNLELNKMGGKVRDPYQVSLEEAMEISINYNIPLHPNYIYYWNQINYEQFLGLIDWLMHSRINDGKLLFPYNPTEKERFKTGKRALELIGACHDVTIENVVLDKEETKSFLVNLGFDPGYIGEFIFDYDFKNQEGLIEALGIDNEKLSLNEIEGVKVLGAVNKLSKFKIKDKAGEFIGARMGRPEKAKIRKLTGSPCVLFPVGEEGGRLRSVNEAGDVGFVTGDFPFNYCKKCNRETIYNLCEVCFEKTEPKYYCKVCDREIKDGDKCPLHDKGKRFKKMKIDLKHYFDSAKNKLGYLKVEIPALIKGIRGTSSENHNIENLVKGILRAKYGLTVNKDGTIRYDMTELPLTHFKAKEIEVSIEKLKELGYVKDINGKDLTNDSQILELKPHDVILPCNKECGDEKADDVFLNIANFIDELLEKFYSLPKFYNLKKREDLVGQLGVCMAPHNCAGVICRFVGFSKVQGLLASPYMHAAIRRDCVFPTTNFIYLEDNQIKTSKIGEYVENLIKQGNQIKKIDSFGTERIDIDKEIYALGLNPSTKKLVKKKIKYFVKGKPPEKWIKIKTCTGREQIMTPRHKFVYLDKNNNLRIKTASEIEKGDRIGILKNFGIKNSIKKLFLPEELIKNVPFEKLEEIRVVNADSFFKGLVERIGEREIRGLLRIKHKSLNDWYKAVPLSQIKILIENKVIQWKDLPKESKLRTIFNNKEWDFYFKIDKGLMSILGYYCSEGYSRQNKTVSQISFRIMKKEIRRKLIKSIQGSFGLKASLGEDKTKITICNKLIYYLFKYCLKIGEGAYLKKVPDILYNVNDDFTQEFLSSYFDGDGTIVYNKYVGFYSVSREMLDGISLLISRFGIFGRFSKTKARLPGKKVLERYKELKKDPKKHILNHLIYSGKDFYLICKLLSPCQKRKKEIIKNIKYKLCRDRKIKFNKKYHDLIEVGDIFIDYVSESTFFSSKENSYCFEIDWKNEEDKNVLWGEQIINARCDGDEAAIMLLSDVLINFSRTFLPSHRGGTQDAPLVLNGRINAREVDDQILDFEVVNSYPLELYEKAEQKKHSSELKIEMVKQRLAKDEDPFYNTGFTHETSDFNMGVTCSSYKTLPTMQEKVAKQMELCVKLRSVDQGDVARLIIDRHFMRDLKGNLRKFSQQTFRCGKCNEIYRRPPLNGKCSKCGNPKLIFTISYGSIVKYLEPALDLTKNFNVPPYIRQDLELTKKYIESIFGKETEKQEAISRWF